jgi:hypothetical protein
MTRYQVFVNHSAREEATSSDGLELVACEIAVVICGDDLPASHYVAYVEDTPAATMETLRSIPKFSIELNSENVEMWNNVVQPLNERIDALTNSIDEAYSLIAGAKYELDELISDNDLFEEIDQIGRKGIERGFEYLMPPDKEIFVEKIEEIFSVKNYQSPEV